MAGEMRLSLKVLAETAPAAAEVARLRSQTQAEARRIAGAGTEAAQGLASVAGGAGQARAAIAGTAEASRAAAVSMTQAARAAATGQSNVQAAATAAAGAAVAGSNQMVGAAGRVGPAVNDNIARAFQRAEQAAVGSIKNIVKGMAALIVPTASAAGLIAVTRAAGEAERQMQRLSALVEITGGTAGYAADELEEMARRLDDMTLASTQSARDAIGQLLSYTAITGEAFEKTLFLAQDLSEVFRTDLRSNVEMLGKALEMPSRGLAALEKQGFRFTEAQKYQLKVLEESGRLHEAQAIIMASVADVVGGAGRAAALGYAGAVDALNKSVGLLREEMGARLLPMATSVVKGLNDLVLGITGNLDTLGRATQAAAAGLATLGAAYVVANLGAVAGAIMAARAATIAWTAALAANPIGLIAVGIAAAVSAMVYYRDTAFEIAGTTVTIGGVLNAVWVTITESIKGTITWLLKLLEAIGRVSRADFDGAANSLRDAFVARAETRQTIKDAWKNVGPSPAKPEGPRTAGTSAGRRSSLSSPAPEDDFASKEAAQLAARVKSQELLAAAAGKTAVAQMEARRVAEVYTKALVEYGEETARAVLTGGELPEKIRAFAAALAQIDLATREGELAALRAQTELQLQAEERLAAAAGLGAAVQREAAAANAIAAAAAKGVEEAAIATAAAKRQEAAAVATARAETVASLRAQTEADTAMAAAVLEGTDAVRAAERAEYERQQQLVLGQETVEALTAVMEAYDARVAASGRLDMAKRLSEQNRELRAITALTQVEAQMIGRSNRERRLAIAHQEAINEAARLGVDLTSEQGKQWLANADAIAAARIESEKVTAAVNTARGLGGLASAILDGDYSAISDALGSFLGDFQKLKDATGSWGEAASLLGKQLLESAEAGMALGNILGSVLGRSAAQQRNAQIGGSIGGTIGSFFGLKGVGAFVGNVLGGLFGRGKAGEKADKAAVQRAEDLERLTGSIGGFVSAAVEGGEALRALDAEFASLSAEARRLGRDTRDLEAAYATRRARLIDDANAGMRAELARLTGDVVGLWEALRRENERAIAAAIAGEQDVALARALAAERERQWVEQRSAAELEALGAVIDAADLIKARMRDLLAGVSTAIDRQLDMAREAARTARQAAAGYREAQRSLAETVAGLRIGALSPLTGQQQLAEARRQYEQMRAAAAGGDVGALRGLGQAATRLLELGRDWTGGAAYQELFSTVTGDLEAAGVTAGALASAAEYQAELLEIQVRVLEDIRDHLAGPSVSEELLREQLAALGVVQGLLSQSNDLTIGQTGALSAQQQQARDAIVSVTREVKGSLDLGLNIVDAPSVARDLALLERALVGVETAEAQRARDAIALLRQTTSDGLVTTAEAGPVRAALATLQAVLAAASHQSGEGVRVAVNAQTGQVVRVGDLTAEQRAALLEGNSLADLTARLVATQTQAVLSGNAVQDTLARLMAQDTALSQRLVEAISGGTAVQQGIIQAIVASGAQLDNTLREYLALSRRQAEEEARRQAESAAAAARQAQIDAAGSAARSTASSLTSQAASVRSQATTSNDNALAQQFRLTTGAVVGEHSDRGESQRDRANALRAVLVGGAQQLEALTGGVTPSDMQMIVSSKYGLRWTLGGQSWAGGINDHLGFVTSAVRAMATQMTGLSDVARQAIAGAPWSDLPAALDHIARMVKAAAFSTGGPVRGPGTATSDSILAWLSNGEHVIKAATVGRYGHDVIERVNQGDLQGAVDLAVAKGVLPAPGRYAGGGPVGPQALRLPAAPALPAVGLARPGQQDVERELRLIAQELRQLRELTENGQEAQGRDADRAERLLAKLKELAERADARLARAG